jgi:hypothetical protein
MCVKTHNDEKRSHAGPAMSTAKGERKESANRGITATVGAIPAAYANHALEVRKSFPGMARFKSIFHEAVVSAIRALENRYLLPASPLHITARGSACRTSAERH